MNTTEQEPCPECTGDHSPIPPIGPCIHQRIAKAEALAGTDSIVAELITMHLARAQKGADKYGVTLDRTDLAEEQWEQHLLEELMDAPLYLLRLRKERRQDRKQLVSEFAAEGARLSARIAELETQRTETMEDYKRQAERIAELEAALEEREADMHARIRAGYDSSVVACWKAAAERQNERISELEAENGRLVALVDSLATRFPDVATNVTAWAKQQKLAPHYCPKCSQPLQRVRQSADSMLNAEQFAAIRSGDWFCDCGGPDTDGYRYFWQSELPAPPKGEEVAS